MEKAFTRPGLSNRKRGIATIDFLSEAEKQQFIYGFNDTEADYPEEATLVSLIDQRAEANPNNIAFSCKGNQVTYRELKEKSDRIAAYLREEYQVKVGDMVGLLLDRDEHLVPLIVGVLKAGAAYVPIDPAYPAERINAIITDAKLSVLITREQYNEQVKQSATRVINLDAALSVINNYPVVTLPDFSNTELAYVIYTSGSTGTPKGVMIEHRAAVNYITWASAYYFNNEKATFPLYSSISFDLTVTSIFAPLVTGNTIIVYEEEAAASLIEKVITDNLCDVIKLTPSHLKIIRDNDFVCVRPEAKPLKFIVGGENLETQLARDIYDKLEGNVEIYNEYGPTETTVGCMICKFTPDINVASVPIGVPVNNTQIYILDKFLKPVGNNITGEIYISGDGLARGYLGQPLLTSEKFVNNPFIEGARMYKSGDHAKRLADGNIIFLGRIDEQVKINGYRIELDEIENHLSAYEHVKGSVVVAKEKNDSKYLVAYYVADEQIDAAALKHFLGGRLPGYMVPLHFVRIDQVPLTTNGKVNRKALPDPEMANAESYIPPSNETEEILVDIWAEVLRLEKEKIGVNRSFIELGGHSVKIISMLGKVQKALNVKVPINEVFNHPDIGSLSRYIQQIKKESSYTLICKAEDKPYYTLSSAQRRLYFLYELDQGSLAYNMPKMLRLKGTLNKEQLNNAFNQLAARHESIRTLFEVIDGEPVMKIVPRVTIEIKEWMADEKEVDTIIKTFVQPFDLATSPLFRVGLITLEENDHILMIDMHHIIADGVSEEVLTADFIELYKGEELPALPLQYKDYTAWKDTKEQQAVLAAQREYWMKNLSGEIPSLSLPVDFPRPAFQRFDGNVVSYELEKEQVIALKLLAEKEGATVFMVLLAVYNILLSKLSNQDDIVIGTPVAGRTHPDLEKVMGVFINMLPIRNAINREQHFRAFLSAVKSKVLAGIEHQEFPYEELINVLNIKRDTSRNPLFDVAFTYQHIGGAELAMPGLTVAPYNKQHAVSKLDLTLEVVESKEGIALHFEYCTALFRRKTIERFAACLLKVLSTVTRNRNIQIADIEIVPENEKQWLLNDCNNTRLDYPAHETIVSLFEKQVKNTPEKTAIVYEGNKLTYEELNEQANAIAHYLINQCNVKFNDTVGIMAERSEKMLVCLLGILKAGAAYLPVDPSYPDERKTYMLEDSGAQVLLVCGANEGNINFNGNAINLDQVTGHNSNDLHNTCTPADLCYVMYTSGSTGKPKGVMITHGNVVNFMKGMSNNLPVNENDCMLAVTSISFDISVLELFWTLCNGIEVVIHPADITLSGLDRYVADKSASVDFSLFFFSSYNNKDEHKYNLLLESVKYVDDAGFKAVWVPERHFHEFGGLYPNPSVVSAALAMITKKIELRSGSVVSPLHDAIRIAEEWSVVDNLSKGRVGLSFASGWNANDFSLARDAYKERQKIMYEQIQEVRKLWKGEPVKRINGAGQEKELRIFPVPIQKELPVWITSSGNIDTFKSAGAVGANVLTHLLGQDIDELAAKIKAYRTSLQEHGYNENAGKVSIMLHTYIGEDPDEVEKLVEAPFTEYLKSAIGLNKIVMEQTGLNPDEIPESEMQVILKNAFKRYYSTGSLIGTKSKCSDMILKLRSIGVDEIACLVDFGVEESKVLEGLKHLKTLKNLFAGHNAGNHKPVTMMQSTPSFIKIASEGTGSGEFLKSLRLLLLGGEALPLALVNKLNNEIAADIYNMYGPTETTVWSCMHKLQQQPEKISVGKPIANTQIYILDKNKQLVPVGVTGELYIGGKGLAKGYWNRESLTEERFIDNPFLPEEKIYNTGDLARWNEDGTIELIGREDKQVKIRGHRIELGEIEAALSAYKSIQESAVICSRQDDDQYLVAYYTSDRKIQAADLRNFLSHRLPDYMIPAYYVQLEKMPLTLNGKLDRKSLPDPKRIAVEDYVAPSNDMQVKAAEIWSSVLKMDKEMISIDKSFFEMGGNSLNAAAMINKMNQCFDLKIPLNEVFNRLTIERLVDYIITVKQTETATAIDINNSIELSI